MRGRCIKWLFDVGLEESVCAGSPEREEEVPCREGNEVPHERIRLMTPKSQYAIIILGASAAHELTK